MKNLDNDFLAENLDSILESVSLMRAWQKKYFRTRSHDALAKSIFFESMVDSDLETISAEFYEDKERSTRWAKSQGLWPSE